MRQFWIVVAAALAASCSPCVRPGQPSTIPATAPVAHAQLPVPATGPARPAGAGGYWIIYALPTRTPSDLDYLFWLRGFIGRLISGGGGANLAVAFWPNRLGEPVRVWTAAEIAQDEEIFDDSMQSRLGTPEPAAFGAGLTKVCDLAEARGGRIAVVGRELDEWIDRDQLLVLRAVSRRCAVDLFYFEEGQRQQAAGELAGAVSGYVYTIREGSHAGEGAGP